MFVNSGLSTVPFYFKTERAVCCEGQWDRLLQAALCTARSTRTGPRTVCKTTLVGLFTAEAPFGRGRRAGRQAGRQGRKERGFTTLKRVGIPPEPFPHLAGSCENNCLAFTLSLCRWSSSYESALRAASGGESGGLVISCTVNISVLYRNTRFLMCKLLRAASSLTLLFVPYCINDIHYFCFQCLVFPCRRGSKSSWLTKCVCVLFLQSWLTEDAMLMSWTEGALTSSSTCLSL